MNELTETQMELVNEPIKRMWRCTRNAPYSSPNCPGNRLTSARQGHYVSAATKQEALDYMRCQFPHDTDGFTAHPWK